MHDDNILLQRILSTLDGTGRFVAQLFGRDKNASLVGISVLGVAVDVVGGGCDNEIFR